MYIYMIKNPTNGKSYIGQTVDFKRRVRGHFTRLTHNEHPNQYLQNSWNKNKNLIIGIICKCNSREELNKKEREYIKKYKTHWAEGGYNIQYGGCGNHTMCKSTKQKLRKHKTGLKQTKETIEKRLKTWSKTGYMKKVYRYTLDGVYVDTFNNAKEVSKVINRNPSTISVACKKENINCGGYLFSYVKKDKLKPHKPRQYKGHRDKAVIQYNKEKKIIQEYKSITEASKQTNIKTTSILNCIGGRSNTAGGYIWKYKEV